MKGILSNKKIYIMTSYILIICLLFTGISNSSFGDAFAANETGGWVVTDKYGAEVKDDFISWTATHREGDVNYTRYRTKRYEMSINPYATGLKFKEGTNATIETFPVYVSSEPDGVPDANGLIQYRYTISRKTFMEAATSALVGITGGKLHQGAITVYLNPVYEVYIGNSVLDGWNNIFGLQEMLAYPDWSSTTRQLLPALYNESFTIQADTYNMVVKAIDEEKSELIGAKGTNGSTISWPLNSQKLIVYEEVKYDLPTSYITLDKNGTKYVFDHYYYKYTPRAVGGGSLPVKTSGTNSSQSVFMNDAPDAVKDSTMTVYMVYKKQETKYKRKIVAVDKDLKYIKDLTGEMEVTSGGTVSYTTGVMDEFTYNKVEYHYQHKWYYTYKDMDGKVVREPLGSGTYPGYVYKKPLPMAQENSLATFYMIYDTDIPTPPTPPITPPAEPTPKPEEPTPKPEEPTPFPSVPPIQIPAPATERMPFTNIKNTGVLRADVRESERFVATLGVPTTESLYGEVRAKEYLLGYEFRKKVGKKDFVVNVTRDYILEWYSMTPEDEGDPEIQRETVTVSHPVSVPRGYGYWEIINLECFKISNATLYNYALPDGSITMYPNMSYYNPPTASVFHSEDENYHILPPDEVARGIKLDPVTIAAPEGLEKHKPFIPIEQFQAEATYVALTQTGKAKVRSDSLIFNGRTVISNAITEWEAPDINISAIPQCYNDINKNVLYKPNNIIEATKKNGTYATLGNITFTKVTKVNSSKPDNPNYPIDGLNNVVIHTPVVCIPAVVADNDKYVQLINPTQGCVQLVLDPDPNLSDFTVHISNTGFHSGKQGYFTRDFSRSIRDPNISYISLGYGLLKNQVKFPFDVYIDTGVSNDPSDDDFIKASTWITIDRNTPRFYLPMTVHEGVYRADFRTIAVNGEPFLNNTEASANTSLYNYVATDTKLFEVSGRMYGLTIYDITDYPVWEEVFRRPKSMGFKKDSADYPDGTSLPSFSSGRSYTYKIGTNDQYGNDTGRDNKYTLPLVNGSHPKYKNQGILKTGYYVRFMLETTGNMFSDACMVSIKPNFYYVDKDGENRKSVDLYYSESINNKTRYLVRVGSSLDQINLKKHQTGDLYLGIPEVEMKQTAALRGITYNQFIYKYEAMFNFSDIRLHWAFRTYTNNAYLNRVKAYDSYSDVTAAGITDGDVIERMQRWYGQYYLPNEVHVVQKGFDVMDYADKYGVDYDEDFWLTDGYIIVNFTIETVGEDGKRRLSYINYSNYRDKGHCSMWLLEGPVISKTSHKGPAFDFKAGDFIIYYTDKRMSEDYHGGAIY